MHAPGIIMTHCQSVRDVEQSTATVMPLHFKHRLISTKNILSLFVNYRCIYFHCVDYAELWRWIGREIGWGGEVEERKPSMNHRLFKFGVGLAYASVYPLCPQTTWKDWRYKYKSIFQMINLMRRISGLPHNTHVRCKDWVTPRLP
jgi:hypothetical protein